MNNLRSNSEVSACNVGYKNDIQAYTFADFLTNIKCMLGTQRVILYLPYPIWKRALLSSLCTGAVKE